MLIAFDIDDVLSDLVPALARFHNERYGTSLRKEDFHSYRFAEVLGGTDEEAIKKIWEFLDNPLFAQVPPTKDSVEVIKELAKKHRIISITSRHRKYEDLTREWIARHFPNCIGSIYFSHNSYVDFGNNKRKVDYCLEFNVKTLVEDSLEYAIECRKAGIDVLLLDQPWNKSESLEGIVRVRNWQEILEYFK